MSGFSAPDSAPSSAVTSVRSSTESRIRQRSPCVASDATATAALMSAQSTLGGARAVRVSATTLALEKIGSCRAMGTFGAQNAADLGRLEAIRVSGAAEMGTWK